MTILQRGSRGDDVKQLQSQLNTAGNYGLDVDGAFGPKTQAALTDWQGKNGLSGSGIFDTDTYSKMFINRNYAEDTAGGEAPAAPEAPARVQPGIYDQTKKANEYAERLAEVESRKPGEFSSDYKQQMDDIYAKIMGRQPFSYDMRADALYRNYRDQYVRDGRMAMEDTMGQAAGLTGGYGSTYSQNAGQQQYNAYLSRLNDRIPELEQRAYERYAGEGQDLLNQYAMARQGYDDDYSRYRDQYTDWERERDFASDAANRSYDEAYKREQDLYDRYTKLMAQFGYQPTEEELAAAGIPKEEAELWIKYWQDQQKPSGGGGGSSNSTPVRPVNPFGQTVADGVRTAGSNASTGIGSRLPSLADSVRQAQEDNSKSTDFAENVFNDVISKGGTPADAANRIIEAAQAGYIDVGTARDYVQKAEDAASKKRGGQSNYSK